MGTQINIETRDMLKAGWSAHMESMGMHEDGDALHFLVFTKGDMRLDSYSDSNFCADCNNWGNNNALFKELGLFNLPHILS